MAMALMRAKVGPESAEWEVGSAGVWGPLGYPAAVNARLALGKKGIDLEDHRSRPVDRDLLASYNLILTMERGHKEALRAAFPELAARVYMLREMVNDSGDIADPIGHSLTDFEHTVDEIDQILTNGYQRIYQLSAGMPESNAAG